MAIPAEVARLDWTDAPLGVELKTGRKLRAKTAVIAAGARYRRPAIPNLTQFEGRGVWYWASPIEARMCRQEELVLIGGGNSAGQAAVFLSGYAKKIYMLVRGKGLQESMSRYLVDRSAATSNEVLTETELVAVSGSQDSFLERVRWRHNPTGQETEKPIRHVFMFIGADPATEWLRSCGVNLDDKGFVLTGMNAIEEGPTSVAARQPMSLETSHHGVFAVGDIRSGSVKRVGAAIGEGAAVVPQLHAFLTNTVQVLPGYAPRNTKKTVAA
jgi:thioredoxin reductase (NADPH)